MWVFGYGSLVWRAPFPWRRRVNGCVGGAQRRFYQLSIDHRGTPQQPGRVVTLLPAEDTDLVWGVAYEISDEDRDNVTEYLDFREKNGYVKKTVKFYPAPSEENIKEPFDLTVYIATTDNPSFAGHADIDTIARQVILSVGPSGTNKEYVYNLASAMRLIAPNVVDDHLYDLETAVKRLDVESFSEAAIQ